MKKKISFKILIILFIIIIFIVNKCFVLLAYKNNINKSDVTNIFNETIIVKNIKKLQDNILAFEEISIYDFFEDYEEDNKNTFIMGKKYENNELISYYSIASRNEFIKDLVDNKFELYNDAANKKRAKKAITKYLKKNNINNDIDLLKHIKNNYYFKSSFFDSIDNIRNKYIMNTFIYTVLPEYKSIKLIDGELKGIFIEGNTYSVIYLIYNNKLYEIVLMGEEIKTIEFVNRLLETVNFNLN